MKDNTTNTGSANDGKRGNRLREFFELNEVFGYFFRKKDPSRPAGFNIRAMHTINKIAIIMFLICLAVIIKRYLFGY